MASDVDINKCCAMVEDVFDFLKIYSSSYWLSDLLVVVVGHVLKQRKENSL
jgi:hypothetical protein